MATEFYVEQADRSPQSGLVTEEVVAGELISDDGDGVTVLTFADSGENAGLARYDAQSFAREFDDDVRTPTYDPNDDMRNRAQYQRFEDSGIFRIRTIDDESAAAPAISHRDVVGYVDESEGDAPADAEGRLVEEGYTNGATTFDRSTGNFKAVGVAYRPSRRSGQTLDEYDYPVRTIMFSEPKAE